MNKNKKIKNNCNRMKTCTFFFHPVPLGSIREVPAESCEEIKASEGEEALCKNWLKPASSAESTLVHCYLNTKGWLQFY